jgi:hypothetical protein
MTQLTSAHSRPIPLRFRVTRQTAVKSWTRKSRTCHANWTKTNVLVGHKIRKVIWNERVNGSISSPQNGVPVQKRQPQISTSIRNVRIRINLRCPLEYGTMLSFVCCMWRWKFASRFATLPYVPLLRLTASSLAMHSLLDEWYYHRSYIIVLAPLHGQ